MAINSGAQLQAALQNKGASDYNAAVDFARSTSDYSRIASYLTTVLGETVEIIAAEQFKQSVG